ncbi:MAG: hypothetical protein EH225_06510 [Calditrichaeota bacterium]|nr:hypothetical protein [Calditrichota bacterium]RQV93035.1 MAG: hypothetical protein EH221_10345 [bacterium]RQW03926.1 MAG: hypothetical protein EH225_06510 [Calditrichota bacterium]
MQRETKSLVWGIILILIGFLFLGHNLDWFNFDWNELWPLVMIAGGLFFWIGWLSNRREFGLLMPGTILMVYGLMFQYSALHGWYYMDELWPGFLLGPGLGFFFMYLLGNREKGLLITACILIALSVIFWIGEGFRYFWPVLFIAIGIYLLFKSRSRKPEVPQEPETTNEQPGSQ